MKKKVQVFVSSTFIDLKSERESAVQAILDAGHIPAGMELFRAGNESQLETIKKWIRDSDLYMLILGGRYGSIETSSSKSYTHVEYEYAISLGIPVFALVLSDLYLHNKSASANACEVYEQLHMEKYRKFKELVMSKIVRLVNDEKDIQIEVFRSINTLIEDYDLPGWVRGLNYKEFEQLKDAKAKLLEENAKLKKEIKGLEVKLMMLDELSKDKVGDYPFTELKRILLAQIIEVPPSVTSSKKPITLDAYNLFLKNYTSYATGIDNSNGMSEGAKFLFFKVAPLLLSYGLVERVKLQKCVVRIQTSQLGSKFYGRAVVEGDA